MMEERSSATNVKELSLFEQTLSNAEIVDTVFSHLDVKDITALAKTSKSLLTIYEQEVRRKVPMLAPPVKSKVTCEFVELGAGPMCSAISLWASFSSGVFTEYRSIDQLFKDYGLFVGNQFLKLWKEKSNKKSPSGNAVMLGVDATCLVKAPCILQTAVLRFTNPNIGNQDVTNAINTHLAPAIKLLDEHKDALWVRSGRQAFKLQLPQALIKWLKAPETVTNAKEKTRLYGLMKQTAWVIAVYRNIDLLGRFFANAAAWLAKEGEVQLVVLEEYIEQWNVLVLAKKAGWQCTKGEEISLGFTHMQTQEALAVTGNKKTVSKETVNKKRKNILLHFRPVALIKQIEELIEFISKMEVNSPGKHLVVEVRDIGTTSVSGEVVNMGYTWE